MDAGEARRELWRRYDAGELDADELEVRLRRVDAIEAGSSGGAVDDSAVEAAVAGPIPVHRRRSVRRVVVGLALVAASAIAAGTVAGIAGGLGDPDDGTDGSGVFGVGVATTAIVGGAFPARPAPALPECDLPEPEVDLSDEEPANPALLSDPPIVPDGYEVDSDGDIPPGLDPDSSLSIAAGTPAPLDIRGRTIDGDLVARLRGFRYESPEAADAAGASAARSACANIDRYEVPDHPELYGVVVSGVIPDTAFVSFVLGERRVVVAVESEGDIEEAKALAEQLAAAELEAARTAPDAEE